MCPRLGSAGPRAFAAQHADDAVYIDHAFRGARSRRDAIEERCVIWCNAITKITMTEEYYSTTFA